MLASSRKKYLLPILIAAGIMPGCDTDTKKPRNEVIISKPRDKASAEVLPGVDKSPMDIAYYPIDYPVKKMTNSLQEPLLSRIIYSRPRKDGRVIFGDVVKYGSVWRMGANEASEIEFFRDVTINKQKVPKGRYTIYAIPSPQHWNIILNSDLFTWGLKIDSTKDVFKFDIPVGQMNPPAEILTMEYSKSSSGVLLNIEWDSVKAALPINY